ncbi:MAG: signal peptidase I [Nitrosopumilus sp.]|nr:signal peptidase I [Nitrosopumilus sp.]MDH3824282.1 signal peptidase I [Nitrosopumilus sp.]
MTKRAISKNLIKDLVIVGMGVIIIWIGLQVAFGTENPFYVVASGSMIPELQVYDVLIVQGHVSFEDIQIGDIIVFDRPSGHDRVIVHRVVSITDEDPKTLRTKGDNNVASIPGTDFPITKQEYIGKVEYVIPQIGYVTQVLKPPTNYILIVLVIGVMIVKEIIKRRNVKELALTDPLNANDPDSLKDYSDLEKLKKDSAYSEHSDSRIPDNDSIEYSKETKKDNKEKFGSNKE